MLINPTVKNDAGFNPNVNQTIIPAIPDSKQKNLFNTLVILSWILIIPGLVWWILRIKKANDWIDQQMQIDNAASAIDVNLTKRFDTLSKMVEQTKGYLKFEKETFENIAKYRSGNFGEGSASLTEKDRVLTKIASDINVQFERYPELKAQSVIMELMSASQYVEQEIAASRRLYNSKVTRFNSDILQFPNICIAHKNNLNTIPQFAASAQEKQDVSMSSLSSL